MSSQVTDVWKRPSNVVCRLGGRTNEILMWGRAEGHQLTVCVLNVEGVVIEIRVWRSYAMELSDISISLWFNFSINIKKCYKCSRVRSHIQQTMNAQDLVIASCIFVWWELMFCNCGNLFRLQQTGSEWLSSDFFQAKGQTPWSWEMCPSRRVGEPCPGITHNLSELVSSFCRTNILLVQLH